MAVAAVAPFPLSGRRIEARQNAVVEAVHEAAGEEHVRELGLHPRRLPHLTRLPCLPGARELQELRPDAVSGRDEQQVFSDRQRLRDVRLAARPRMLPQDHARHGVVRDDAAGIEGHDLRTPEQRDERRRAVGRRVVAGRPRQRAIHFAIRQQRAAGATAVHDHEVSDDERRADLAEIGQRAAALDHHVVRPELLSGAELERVQEPGRADREHAPVLDRRGRARAVARHHRFVAHSVGMGPDEAA